MAGNTQTFQCPSCGASLEIPPGAATMKCGYCGTSVVIPQELRSPSQENFGSISSLSMDFGQLMSKAIRMGEVVRLVRSGNKAEAVKLYQENTGVSSEQAEKVIEAIATSGPIALEMNNPGFNLGEVASAAETVREMQQAAQPVRRTRRSGCGSIIAFVIVIAAALAIITFIGPSGINSLRSLLPQGISAAIPAGFAQTVLTFGEQGTGAGMMDDPRSIAVSPDGNIFVADYSDGRIQSFDPTGKFLALISAGTKTTITGMVAGRNGNLYVNYSGEIWIYDARTGHLKGKLDYSEDHYFETLAIGPDGSLYAISNGEDILRFDQDGKLTLSIPAAISTVTGDPELDTRLAVDGLGNIYALGTFTYSVFKFSPDGKYMNRFGSEGDGAGKFNAPEAIAVDGYGRVFVSDFSGVQIFDSDGAYQRTMDDPGGNFVYGMSFDDQNNLFATTNGPHVVKVQIAKP